MTSEPLMLHALSDGDEEHGPLYDEGPRQRVSIRKHVRQGSVFDELIKPVWARQRKSWCNTRTLSISCAVGLVVLLGFSLLNHTLGSTDDSQQTTDTKHFFVFGDSYSRTGFDPYGSMPSSNNPFGNPLHPATTSGGLNWAQILSTQYNSSITYMYNLAAGGATVEKEIIPPPHNAPVKDFGDQLYLYNKTLKRKGAPGLQERKDGLFAVWFGQNDVDQCYNRTYSNPNATFESTFDVYFDHVSKLWHSGAREFLFVGVSPISKSPMVRVQQNVTEVEKLSRAFNDRLGKRIRKFADQHEDVTWRYYDPASAFERVWADPKRFGIKNVNCKDSRGVKCVWQDHFHPGMRVHEQFAADIAALGSSLFAVRNASDSTNIEETRQ